MRRLTRKIVEEGITVIVLGLFVGAMTYLIEAVKEEVGWPTTYEEEIPFYAR